MVNGYDYPNVRELVKEYGYLPKSKVVEKKK